MMEALPESCMIQEGQAMSLHDDDLDRNPPTDAMPQDAECQEAPRPAPRVDARGRILPITPEQQARNAKAIAAFIERMRAMPDDDPPGAWEEAMRDLDAHRPHRKLFEGYY
jgi:hypothetical protein